MDQTLQVSYFQLMMEAELGSEALSLFNQNELIENV
jgi:hypothetical protein